jgi:hypothetical protein
MGIGKVDSNTYTPMEISLVEPGTATSGPTPVISNSSDTTSGADTTGSTADSGYYMKIGAIILLGLVIIISGIVWLSKR